MSGEEKGRLPGFIIGGLYFGFVFAILGGVVGAAFAPSPSGFFDFTPVLYVFGAGAFASILGQCCFVYLAHRLDLAIPQTKVRLTLVGVLWIVVGLGISPFGTALGMFLFSVF